MNELELKKRLHYNSDTGIWTWIFDNGRHCWKGKPAGSIFENRYIRISIDRKNYFSHRLAFLYMIGRFPNAGMETDHINGNGLDNRWCNLREVTNRQNGFNKLVRKNSASGFKGVFFIHLRNKWEARLKLNGKDIYLGQFLDKNDAAKAYKEASLFYHGEFSRV